ncbi:D-amino-acid oxidase [Streptomyces prasinopilosus]|uniref:D-amino-acid oxidase n=1 Tax=Streptomyces prasinopilosus TaxID=67344 RepID=A0A1G7BF45_9ACTN|nr:D-amino-acid oxidase [Streptomyces prasinopilosus]
MGSEQGFDVRVIGGGVAGLTTAVVLAGRGARVGLWTRDPVERTTSAVAGALWWPYRIEPVASARAWALRSLDVYERLAARPEVTGVRMVEGVLGGTTLDEVGAWAAARLPGLRASSAEEYPWGPGCGRGCRSSTCRSICPGCGGGSRPRAGWWRSAR